MAPEIFASLDIGSTKITCFIAEKTESNLKLIGFSQISSFGIQRGVVVNMQETAQAIEKVIEQAANMAGVDIESVSICVGGISLESKITDSMLILHNKAITSEDVEKLVDLAKAKHVETNKKILHAIPVDYTLDDYKGIKNPLNMVGSKLEAKINIISAKQEPLKNIIRAVELAGFYIDEIIASNVANGYSALIEDEKQLGTCLIDVGGFSTDISIYYNGKLILIDSINLGAYHVTSDLAHGLSVSLEDAERIKSLEGATSSNLIESGKSIEYVKVGDLKDNVNFVSHSYVCGIIQPRMEEILELVKNKIAPYQHIFNNRIVLTGGGSNLKGITDLAQIIFNSSIRVASVNTLEGTTNISSNPRFITVSGGIIYLSEKHSKQPEYSYKNSKFGKMLFNFKKSFFK
ncbi:MAG TPA: cell division protein FtsA [Alphaproteobacteria bacterium]|nr:cell division protein FtsA [Alphaproteobacteria bacterium]